MDVFATIQSITGNESTNARVNGMRPACMFLVWGEEYTGQREIMHHGKKLTVYRTYERTDGKTELYTEKRVGKWHGNKG